MKSEKLDVKTDTRLVPFQFSRLASALLLLIGHFLPWAQHSTAALTQSAHDLAISTHFTPGAGVFANEWFFVPVWASALLLALAVAPPHPRTPTSLFPRLLTLAVALGIASLGLPTYPQVLTAYANPDYRVQFFITLVVMAMIGMSLFMSVLPMWVVRFGSSVLAVASAVPLAGYFAVRPAIESLYQDGIGVGAGWWVTLVGTLTLFAIAGATIMGSSSAETLRHGH